MTIISKIRSIKRKRELGNKLATEITSKEFKEYLRLKYHWRLFN